MHAAPPPGRVGPDPLIKGDDMAERSDARTKSNTPAQRQNVVANQDDNPRAGEREKREIARAAGLEAAPESQRSPQGGSFFASHLTGSGTILADGTYGAPLPDPNVERLAKGETPDTPS